MTNSDKIKELQRSTLNEDKSTYVFGAPGIKSLTKPNTEINKPTN